ncbi:hypothetical protein FIM12_04625 [SAR202 cluster bacterium AD-804-J14_MRT_500m]|nr:hypothetical protein [SAR202 cluster bacterium AD-804-J14_MRT_500m]
MQEALRDKSRDKIAASLEAAGIQAEMVDRDLERPEEKIRTTQLFGKSSLGLIDIRTDSPISWINVVRTKRRDKHGPARYRVVFGIPDQNIPMNHNQLKLKTVRKKMFPLFGKVTDVSWRSKAPTLLLAKTLSEDEQIDRAVVDLGDVTIFTHPNQFQGWTIEINKIFSPHPPVVTIDRWKALEKTANHLLSSPV